MPDGVVLANDRSWKTQFWAYAAVEFVVGLMLLNFAIRVFLTPGIFGVALAAYIACVAATYSWLKKGAGGELVYTDGTGIHVKQDGVEVTYQWGDIREIATEVYRSDRNGAKYYRVRIRRAGDPVRDQISGWAETVPFVGYSPQHVCRVLNSEFDRWKERAASGAEA